MSDAFIGLGSNLGDRMGNLRAALVGIDALDETHVLAVSTVVESEPWGVTDQPAFANAVARVTTDIPTERLLGMLKDLEVSLGRQPGEANGPRVIDLDILLVGDEEWDTPELRVPHPRLAERDFVVTPLLEIAPDATWPDGSPITRERATEGRVIRVLGPVPGFEDITPPLGGWHWPDVESEETGAWEEVASDTIAANSGVALASELLFEASVLGEEGIPIGWDPMVPGEEYSPWSLPRKYRLLVPPTYADRARRLLAEVRAARPEMGEPGE